MKTNKLIALACLILSCFGIVKAESLSQASDSAEMKPIVIVRHGNPSTGAPRSQGTVEINAYYDDASCSVVATLANAGTSVDVSIENLSTGESYNDSVSGNGIAVLPISGSSGVWVITFTLSGGEVYEGEFEL